MPRGVAEHRRVPSERTDELARIRVEQQLVRVEAVALARRVRAVCAQTVDQARTRAGQPAVKDFAGVAWERGARELVLAVGVEHAEFDARGMPRADGEGDAVALDMRTERARAAGLEPKRRAHRPDPSNGIEPVGALPAASAARGRIATTDSGGSVSATDHGRPWVGIASASMPPRLPRPEPP